jgi:uncharacterized protein YjiS (DUF1127 family)
MIEDLNMMRLFRTKQRLWHNRIETRNQLRNMDQRLWRDIGLTPLDALTEIRKPFWRG